MRATLTFLLMLFAWQGPQEGGFEGNWHGTLSVSGTKLRIVLDVRRTNENWSAVLASPDQGISQIAIDEVRVTGSAAKFIIKSGAAELDVTLKGDELVGEWRQGGTNLPVRLSRTRPPPYETREVCWNGGSDGVRLCGTLTLPKSAPRGGILLLSGAGPLDRDSSMFGQRPFFVLADHLTRNGYATLRFDQRGVGRSSGDFAALTTHYRMADALTAVTELAAVVGRDRVGLIGHSEGGLVAAMAAAQKENLAFIVTLNAPGLPARELFLMRAEQLLRAKGAGPSLIAADGAVRLAALREVAAGGTEAEVAGRVRAAMLKALAGVSEDDRKVLGYTTAGIDEMVRFHSSNVAWLRAYLDIDPAPVVARVASPTLIVAGELDAQVPAAVNAYSLMAAKRAGGHSNVDMAILPGVNHILQPAKTGLIQEYAQIETGVAESVLERITRWLLNLR